ncbi:MAG: hypothetical protein ACK5O1_07075 [Holosporales bacterium]|jgi:hypothetical protein
MFAFDHRFSILMCLLLLSACATSVQKSSGDDYLSKYSTLKQTSATDNKASSNRPITFNEMLVKAASIEPTLTFPARIGLVRLDSLGPYAKITAIPPEELALWEAQAKQVGPAYGTFIPLDPLSASFAVAAATENRAPRQDNIDTSLAVNKVRLAAARQHLDAVILYGFDYDIEERSFWLINLLTLGSLPTQSLTGRTQVTVMFIDVLQGYSYGYATEFTDKSKMTSLSTNKENIADLKKEGNIAAVEKIIPKTKDIIEKTYQDSVSRKKTR